MPLGLYVEICMNRGFFKYGSEVIKHKDTKVERYKKTFKLRQNPVFIYVGAIVILAVWWGVAFQAYHAITPSHREPLHSKTDELPEKQLLSVMKRDELKSALSGNWELVSSLIHNWDVDAQFLQDRGVNGIKRLPSDVLLKSVLLKRTIFNKSSINAQKRFLPQTYASACFLLAITRPEQIIALPRGLRQRTSLYPISVTEKIPLDIDRHHSEALFLKNPDLAFIAPYSHPSTVEALRNQGIKLFSIDSLNSFEEICEVLQNVGEAVDSPSEASLLRIFMEAAMFAIDNRLVYERSTRELPKTLYASYHSSFSLPTKNNLTSQLLLQLGVADHMKEIETYISQQQWSTPIDQEKIVNFKPDCLIISADNMQGLKKRIEEDPVFEGLRNACRRIVYVDEEVANSPTQYIVLAYYDLLQAVIQQ